MVAETVQREEGEGDMQTKMAQMIDGFQKIVKWEMAQVMDRFQSYESEALVWERDHTAQPCATECGDVGDVDVDTVATTGLLELLYLLHTLCFVGVS